MTKEPRFSFWQWFFRGYEAGPGIARFKDRWLIVHGVVGCAMAALVAEKIESASNSVILPLAGILIGLTFAWAGNAHGLLQTEELDRLSEKHAGGFEEYVFAYQAAIFVILTTLVLWGLAGLRIFDSTWPTEDAATQYFAVKSILFAAASLSLRECWHVVMGAQWMLMAQSHIRRDGKKRPEEAQ